MIKKYTLCAFGLCVLLALGLVIISGHGQAAKATGGKWHISIVDSKGDVGEYNSLALDKNGNPRISYFDGTNCDLKYAKWTGKRWRIEIMAGKIEGGWDIKGRVGGHTSLALDKNGNPRISYYDTNDYLVYAKWTGKTRKIEIVDSADKSEYVGGYASLALDKDGNPRISYCDDANNNLKYAKWDGKTWKTEIVDSIGTVGGYTSLALDKNGSPRISYYYYDDDKGGGDLKYAKWTGETWEIEVVDSAGDVGEYTSLALDKEGNSRISYYDRTNTALKYAKWTGKTWEIETVDSAGWTGMYTSLALDRDGNPRISYYEHYSLIKGNLKYAKWTGKTWEIETVDSAGRVGEYSSLALDKNGNPRISYFDYTNEDLKYAYWE